MLRPLHLEKSNFLSTSPLFCEISSKKVSKREFHVQIYMTFQWRILGVAFVGNPTLVLGALTVCMGLFLCIYCTNLDRNAYVQFGSSSSVIGMHKCNSNQVYVWFGSSYSVIGMHKCNSNQACVQFGSSSSVIGMHKCNWNQLAIKSRCNVYWLRV